MILAFDTYYDESSRAKTVCLAFERWEDPEPSGIHSAYLDGVQEYVPGEFYKRELPCILDLLQGLPYTAIEAIVVDGFVFLDDEGKYGLGAQLYEALGRKIPVIGVAKTNFASIVALKKPVLRGESQKPLFITATGIDADTAASQIAAMHGSYRIPTLLKQLDQLTKAAPLATPQTMTTTQREDLILAYIGAYNRFDTEGMLHHLHPEIVFENVSNGEVNLSLNGIEAFRNQAERAKALFSERRQSVTAFGHPDAQTSEVSIAYEGVLNVDLASGPKKGDRLEMSGRSVFGFADGKIVLLRDIS